MKRIVGFFTIALLALLTTGIPAFARGGHTPKPAGHIVCIDPGHGGTDPGAVMNGAYGQITEANENLAISINLENFLTANGVKWIATRTTDVTLTNAQRYTYCNNNGATLELSIHLNGSTNNTIDYTETLYGKKTKDYTWAQTVDNSLANLSAATGSGTIQNNGVTSYADGVLLKSNMPAALAETVFITNTNEYNLLANPANNGSRQQLIAGYLANAIESWFATH